MNINERIAHEWFKHIPATNQNQWIAQGICDKIFDWVKTFLNLYCDVMIRTSKIKTWCSCWCPKKDITSLGEYIWNQNACKSDEKYIHLNRKVKKIQASNIVLSWCLLFPCIFGPLTALLPLFLFAHVWQHHYLNIRHTKWIIGYINKRTLCLGTGNNNVQCKWHFLL